MSGTAWGMRHGALTAAAMHGLAVQRGRFDWGFAYVSSRVTSSRSMCIVTYFKL